MQTFKIGSSSATSGGSDQLGFESKQLTDGQSAGVQLLTLHCGEKSVDLIPTRGMGIWQAFYQKIRFGWDSPVAGPIHPQWVPISEPSGLGWLDGFDEMMVRCGLSSNGAPEFDDRGQLVWPLHGRIANLPASHVTVEIDPSAGRITAKGFVHEHRFHFHRWQLLSEITLDLNSDEIEIVDRVSNLSERPGSFQMLYHNNFGAPILEPGSQLFAPATRVVPRNVESANDVDDWDQYGPCNPDAAEQVFFLDLQSDSDHQSRVMVTNADRSLGASIRFDTRLLPCFSVWKNSVGLADGYVTGLEPATNFPNPRSFEEQHGRVVEVAPGKMVQLKFSIGMHINSPSVKRAIAEIAKLAPDPPELLDKPIPQWSA